MKVMHDANVLEVSARGIHIAGEDGCGWVLVRKPGMGDEWVRWSDVAAIAEWHDGSIYDALLEMFG